MSPLTPTGSLVLAKLAWTNLLQTQGLSSHCIILHPLCKCFPKALSQMDVWDKLKGFKKLSGVPGYFQMWPKPDRLQHAKQQSKCGYKWHFLLRSGFPPINWPQFVSKFHVCKAGSCVVSASFWVICWLGSFIKPPLVQSKQPTDTRRKTRNTIFPIHFIHAHTN